MLRFLNLKVVFADEYEQLKEDWEKQNAEIDRLISERNRKQKTLEMLRGILEDNAKKEMELLDIIAKLEADLEEKEKQRKTAASKLGGYQKEINKLKDQVEFLKTNRRAPNLEELKNYTQRRKKVQK